MTPKFHRLRVAEVRRETADSVSLKFDVPPSLAQEYRFAPGQHLALVYGNRRQADVMFHEALQDLKDRYLARFLLLNVFSREAQEVELCNGRIDAAKVRELLAHLIAPETIDQAFICGPASMIDEVEGALLAAGVPRPQIHVERFGTPDALPGAMAAEARSGEGAPAAANGADTSAAGLHTTARVTLVIDGVRRDVDYHDAHHAVLD